MTDGGKDSREEGGAWGRGIGRGDSKGERERGEEEGKDLGKRESYMFEVTLCYCSLIGGSLGPHAFLQMQHQVLVEVQYLLHVAEQCLDVVFSEGIVIAMLLPGLLQDVLDTRERQE